MKYAATLANFFLPGLGYLFLRHRVAQSIFVVLGMIGLTFVELQLQKPMPTLYWTMFGSVFVINTMFAIDAWQVASEREESQAEDASALPA